MNAKDDDSDLDESLPLARSAQPRPVAPMLSMAPPPTRVSLPLRPFLAATRGGGGGAKAPMVVSTKVPVATVVGKQATTTTAAAADTTTHYIYHVALRTTGYVEVRYKGPVIQIQWVNVDGVTMAHHGLGEYLTMLVKTTKNVRRMGTRPCVVFYPLDGVLGPLMGYAHALRGYGFDVYANNVKTWGDVCQAATLGLDDGYTKLWM